MLKVFCKNKKINSFPVLCQIIVPRYSICVSACYYIFFPPPLVFFWGGGGMLCVAAGTQSSAFVATVSTERLKKKNPFFKNHSKEFNGNSFKGSMWPAGHCFYSLPDQNEQSLCTCQLYACSKQMSILSIIRYQPYYQPLESPGPFSSCCCYVFSCLFSMKMQ